MCVSGIFAIDSAVQLGKSRCFSSHSATGRVTKYGRWLPPGVNPNSIELTTEQNVLTVRAERRWETQEGDELIVSERPQGTFSRQLFLSDALDADAIQANYDQGVLTLEIPVAEQAKPRRIQVTGSGSGPTTIEGSATRSG